MPYIDEISRRLKGYGVKIGTDEFGLDVYLSITPHLPNGEEKYPRVIYYVRLLHSGWVWMLVSTLLSEHDFQWTEYEDYDDISSNVPDSELEKIASVLMTCCANCMHLHSHHLSGRALDKCEFCNCKFYKARKDVRR